MTESFDEYFERHNGKVVKIEGIAYKIKYSEHKATYPRPHTTKTIELNPVNKNSAYYRSIKAKLKDDWSMDGHQLSDKALREITNQLGNPK